ncbi:phage tail tape measure protein [uncultured Mitsuokella sp.]|uniref:phage tail tape measure protein n=1 Tax=uncultured Mitsuokella sp. TaxID=453120 RepID=UPI002626A1E0|nr:phage tail tape measure protein [uncultured Mitsuokella sp.]
MSDFVLSATFELRDKLTGRIKTANNALKGVKGAAETASGALEKTEGAMTEAGASAVKAAVGAKKLKDSLSSIPGTRTVRISATDSATGKVTGLKSTLQSLTGKAYRITVNAVGNAATKLQGLKMLAQSGGSTIMGAAGGLAAGAGVQMMGAAGMGYGMYDTAKTAMDFEAQMKRVQAISGATETEFAALTNKAKEMGASTQFSATESGQALQYMAMAGWNTNQMLAGIPGVMSLAAASGEDLGRVSDIVTDALTAFGLQAEDSGRFADVLAIAASKSNTNVAMMGETFKYAAPLAGALKYSIEDVSLAIGLMANSGIKASDAGTALRATMVRLVDPPKDAAEALDKLGVKAANADGTMKPLRQTMRELRTAFAGLTDKQKTQMAASIAGQEAVSGFLALIKASDSDFDNLANAIDNANGAAKEQERIMNDNLKGDLKSLSSAWESLQLEFMSGAGSAGLRAFTQTVRDEVAKTKGYISDGFDISDVGKIAADVITKLKDKFLAFDGVGSVLAGGVLAAGLYKIIKLAKRAKDAAGGLGAMGSGLKGAGAAAGALGLVFGGLDVYSQYTNNDEAMRDADKNVAWANESGNEDLIAEANANKAAQAKANRASMGGSVGGAAGGVIGAVAGGALGSLIGPVGTVIGGSLGGMIGTSLGDSIGTALSGVDWSNEAQYVGSGIVNNLRWGLSGISEVFKFIAEGAGNNIQYAIEGIANNAAYATNGIANNFEFAANTVEEAWGSVSEWFEEAVMSQISAAAGSAMEIVEGFFQSAAYGVQSVWAGVGGFFSSLWGSIKSGAASAASYVGEKLASAVDAAKSAATSAWSWASQKMDGLSLGHNASGTSYWRGGLTEVGEHGGEIIDLPQGSRIYPHATTMQMLRDSMGGGTPIAASPPPITVTGNTFTVREEADIDRIAYRLYQLIAESHVNMNGGTFA